MKKVLISIIITALVAFAALFCGCNSWTGETEDLKYTYIDYLGESRTSNIGDYVAVLRPSIEGGRKETIIIPEEIDGRPVIQIGTNGAYGGGYQFSCASSYKKLYLPKTLRYIANGVENEDSKTFIIELDDMKMLKDSPEMFYLSYALYNDFIEKYERYKDEWWINIANTEFIVDGGTYWIDDYDEESLITAPENPIKEGYEFLGWYKEPECENEWDFGTDKVKGKTYDESGEKNINLTTLYAKWQKI